MKTDGKNVKWKSIDNKPGTRIYEEKQKDTDCCDSTFFNRNSCICRIWCLEKVQRYFDAEPGGTDAPDNQNPE